MLLIKINSQYYNISAKEAEILNRLEIESKILKSTTMLDFFTSEIEKTRIPAIDEILNDLRIIKMRSKLLLIKKLRLINYINLRK